MEAFGGVDLVMISAGEPGHHGPARPGMPAARVPVRGGPVATARPDGRRRHQPALFTGRDLLFTNDYECGLLQSKTGWTESRSLYRVGHRVTTHGAEGVEMVAADGSC